MSLLSPLQWLVDRRPVRRAVDRLMTLRARRRVAFLDRCNVAELQEQTLLRLVTTAAQTRFGQDHDFAGIRTIADFRDRVPLRDYEGFWSEYWEPAFPHLGGVTWPSAIPYLALSSGTTSGGTKYVPISKEMLLSNRKAGWTTLAMYEAFRPDLGLFNGRLFFLGGSTDLRNLSNNGRVLSGDLSAIAIREIPSILRPYTFPTPDLAHLRDWTQKMRQLAETSSRLPITLISGVPSWMLVLFERLQQITGREKLCEIWPSLRMIVHGGTKFDPYRELFRRVVGSDDVLFAETYPASEGFVATEDPRYEQLRLIPDHGVFFEFVPMEEFGGDNPTRHYVGEIETGVQYAVVLSSCAGVWSYVLGDTICFEKRDPPLLRFTGRTSYFLSAFGEHLISEEIEKAVATACTETGATQTDFHVGPVFPESANAPGRHRYLIEFVDTPPDVDQFAKKLDESLSQINEDYDAHRSGDLTMLAPEVCVVKQGGFAAWMESRGKLGGQNKVPRMDNNGEITRQLWQWLREHGMLS